MPELLDYRRAFSNLVSRETSEKRILPRNTDIAWELWGSVVSLHQNLEGGTVTNPTQRLKTKNCQLLNIPATQVLFRGGFGDDEESANLQETGRALGSDRRWSEGPRRHEIERALQLWGSRKFLAATRVHLSRRRSSGPGQYFT